MKKNCSTFTVLVCWCNLLLKKTFCCKLSPLGSLELYYHSRIKIKFVRLHMWTNYIAYILIFGSNP